MLDIINAVECNNTNTLMSVIDGYLLEDEEVTIFTDNKRINKLVGDKYGSERSFHDDSIIGLCLALSHKSVLIIMDIENERSEAYKDLSQEYTIISIDDTVTGGD